MESSWPFLLDKVSATKMLAIQTLFCVLYMWTTLMPAYKLNKKHMSGLQLTFKQMVHTVPLPTCRSCCFSF